MIKNLDQNQEIKHTLVVNKAFEIKARNTNELCASNFQLFFEDLSVSWHP